jgi:hypothetical protein
MRNACDSGGNSEGTKSLGGVQYTWKDNIKIDDK